MRNLKKILALVLALMMVLSVMATASATSFADDADINAKYAEAVSVLSGIGVIRGVENADGTFNFNPKGNLNRAQAATIIAYVLTGDLNKVKDEISIYENPFTDVPEWAVDYVLFAHSRGIIVGRNATTFDPNATITGYELGKMLLIATGIENKATELPYTNEDFVTTVYVVDGKAYADEADAMVASLNAGGAEITTKAIAKSNWQVLVASGLKTAKIWNSEFQLSKKLTREEACYLAFNALLASTLDTSIFELTTKDTVDAFGRATKTWVSGREDLEEMAVVLNNYTAPEVIVAKKAVEADAIVAGINDLLGLKKDDEKLTGDPDVYLNGAKGAYAINIGDTVELYTTKDGEITKVVVIREALATVTVAPKAEEGDENPYKGLYKYTFSTGAITYAAKDAYNTKASYLVINNGEKLLNVANPTVISNAKVTKTDKATIAASSYVVVNDQKLVKATVNAITAEGGATYGKGYDYVLNSNGYLVAITDINEVEVEYKPETGYAWLLAAEMQITSSETNGGLLNGDGSYAWNVVAKAKLALADGTTAVVDVNTVVETDDDGKTTDLWVNGVKTADVKDTDGPVTLISDTLKAEWVAYEIQEDGSYILANIDETLTNVKLAKKTAQVEIPVDETTTLTKYATSATVWYSYSYNKTTKTVTVTENVGYNSFDGYNYDILYTVNENVHKDVITAIVSFKDYTPSTTTFIREALYVGGGEFTSGKQAQGFFHDGEYVEYFEGTLQGGSVTPAKGGIYSLTLDAKGNLVKVATYKTTETGVVDFVDDDYVIIDGVHYTNYIFECYNVTEGHTGEVDTLEIGDTVTFAWEVFNNYTADDTSDDVVEILVAYITKEAE